MLHSDHSCTIFMENVQNSIKSRGKLMISELRKFQTYKHPVPRGFCNSEVLLYSHFHIRNIDHILVTKVLKITQGNI